MKNTNNSNPLAVTEVKITDTFWSSMIDKIRKYVLPYQWEALNDRIPNAEPSYAIQNYRVAAAVTRKTRNNSISGDDELIRTGFKGNVF